MSDISAVLRQHGYADVRFLGQGAFGVAHLVQDRHGAAFVCKLINMQAAPPEQQQAATKEVQLLSRLRHKFIVRYQSHFRDRRYLGILMDFCDGGELRKPIVNAKNGHQPIDGDQALLWMWQCFSGLEYVHAENILHRDLKPENIFLTKQNTLQLGDFGIAKDVRNQVAKTNTGTRPYMSPEQMSGRPYEYRTDVWSMGVILYELCVLRLPFQHTHDITGPRPHLPLPSNVANSTRKLCDDLLQKRSDMRPSCREVLRKDAMCKISRPQQGNQRGQRRGSEHDFKPRPRGRSLDAVRGAVHATMKVMRRGRSLEREAPRQRRRPSLDAMGNLMATMAAPFRVQRARSLEANGGYRQGDKVEYFSSSHKCWIPAIVVRVARDGCVYVDCRPDVKLTRDQMARQLRPVQNNQPALYEEQPLLQKGRQCRGSRQPNIDLEQAHHFPPMEQQRVAHRCSQMDQQRAAHGVPQMDQQRVLPKVNLQAKSVELVAIGFPCTLTNAESGQCMELPNGSRVDGVGQKGNQYKIRISGSDWWGMKHDFVAARECQPRAMSHDSPRTRIVPAPTDDGFGFDAW